VNPPRHPNSLTKWLFCIEVDLFSREHTRLVGDVGSHVYRSVAEGNGIELCEPWSAIELLLALTVLTVVKPQLIHLLTRRLHALMNGGEHILVGMSGEARDTSVRSLSARLGHLYDCVLSAVEENVTTA
jgi:hypothetical protein